MDLESPASPPAPTRQPLPSAPGPRQARRATTAGRPGGLRSAALRIGSLAAVCMTLPATGSLRPTIGTHGVDRAALAAARPSADPSAGPSAGEPLARVPLFFIENRGQKDAGMALYAGGRGGQVAFESGGLRLTQTEPIGAASTGTSTRATPATGAGGSGATGPRRIPLPPVAGAPSPTRRHVVHAEFAGARSGARPEGREILPTKVSYFKGPRAQWRTGLATYGRVVYPNLWPGIDLEWEGTTAGVKYTYLVHPGADPALIRLIWHGVERAAVDTAGALDITTPLGHLRDDRPVAYQILGDRRVPVAAAHVARQAGDEGESAVFGRGDPALGARLSGAALARPAPVVTSFALGDYDPTEVLVIDPVIPVYAGFLGFGGQDRALGVASDSAGHAFVTGEFTEAGEDFNDAYVARVALNGGALDYLAIFGGDGGEGSFDVAVDATGHAYATGFTGSDESSFPVSGGPDTSFNGVADAFVVKLAPDGQDLVFAGFLGGELIDFGEGIRVDAVGNVYLHGPVLSSHSTFPVKVGPDLTFNGETDAFVCKILADPSAADVLDNLGYCGYIGGDATDIHMGVNGADSFYSSGHIAIDAAGALYVSGETTSDATTFPDGDGFGGLPGPDQTHAGNWDAFAVKVRPDGTGFAYATFVGGDGDDFGKGMAVDAAGNAYLSGYTGSTEASMPVTVGPDLTYNGGDLDALVAKVAADGRSFGYLGFLGGDDTDGGEAVTVDAGGNLTIVGYTESGAGTFPVVDGPDLTQNDNEPGAGDALVARVRARPGAPDVRANLEFAGYIGGGGNDQAFWVALDAAGDTYVVGDTESSEASFPDGDGIGSLPSWDSSFNGGHDGFVVKLHRSEGIPVTPTTPAPSGKIFMPLALRGVALGQPTSDSSPDSAVVTDSLVVTGHDLVAAGLASRSIRDSDNSRLIRDRRIPQDASHARDSRDFKDSRSARSAASWLPIAIPASAHLGDLLEPGAASPSAPRAANGVRDRPMAWETVLAADQAEGVETSYDDFCDFGIGWNWQDTPNAVAHIAADERLRCYYLIRLATENSSGSVANGHHASGDFAIETAIDIEGRDTFTGLIFAAPDSLDRWITFAVSDRNTFILARVVGGRATALENGTATIEPGRPTKLRAEVRAETITLFVDDKRVAEVADAGVHEGRVGVYTEWDGTGSAELETRHDYIRISRLAPP